MRSNIPSAETVLAVHLEVFSSEYLGTTYELTEQVHPFLFPQGKARFSGTFIGDPNIVFMDYPVQFNFCNHTYFEIRQSGPMVAFEQS